MIDDPKNSLYVENEEMLDKKIEDYLIFAAKRGVDVRVVMSTSRIKMDSSSLGKDRIKKSGVKV